MTRKCVISHGPTHREAAIREFANGNMEPEALRQRASSLLSSRDLSRNFLGLAPEDRAAFLEKVDQAYPTIDSQNARYITALGSLCSAAVRLPASSVLSGGLERRGNIAVASGGLTDIWKGGLGEARVAIKAFRIYPAQNLTEAKEILWKRVPTWKRLSHPNVLPFRGVNTTLSQLALVYDWGENGNIVQHKASYRHEHQQYRLGNGANGPEYPYHLDIAHSHQGSTGASASVCRRDPPRLAECEVEAISSNHSFTVAATPEFVPSRRLASNIVTSPGRGYTAPTVSKTGDLSRIMSQVLGVAKGLQYLHSLDIPHGNVKGSNVVIDRSGRALVTEYGLAPIISGPSFTTTATPDAVSNSRWLAPEIITPPRKGDATPVVESKAADVFAFAMFVVEVLTGRIPFEELENEEVVLHILRGGRPQMPTNAQELGFTREMWKFLESCWHQNPKKRPTMQDVVMRWQRFVEDSVVAEGLLPDSELEGDLGRSQATIDVPPFQMGPEAIQPRKKFSAFLLGMIFKGENPETRSRVIPPRTGSLLRHTPERRASLFCGLL